MTRYEKEFYEMFLNEFPKLVKSINGLKKEISNLNELVNTVNENLEMDLKVDFIERLAQKEEKSMSEVAYNTIVEYVIDKIKLNKDCTIPIIDIIEEELIQAKVFKSKDDVNFDNLVQDILQEYLDREEN